MLSQSNEIEQNKDSTILRVFLKDMDYDRQKEQEKHKSNHKLQGKKMEQESHPLGQKYMKTEHSFKCMMQNKN